MSSKENRAATGEQQGLSRRAFLKCCALFASALALPPSAAAALVEALGSARRQPLIWLSFQECTGCTESLTRSYTPTLERLMFASLSLDYHHTLQAASGEAAEAARRQVMARAYGDYLLAVDGSIPLRDDGACSTIAGISNLELLRTCAAGAKLILAVGTCAAFGGIPAAAPNPTGAVPVGRLMADGQIARKPLVNISGCPPLPVAISATLAHYLTFDRLPELDELGRPLAFYAHTIHDRCARLQFFKAEKFAKRFDDAGARQGWCLYELGCRGPITHNACATVKWNAGTSFPIQAGSPCIGCSEPGFWDRDPFYQPIVAVRAAVEQERQTAREADGRALFEDNCRYCHTADRPSFETPVEDIPELLRSGEVRAHRFEFTEPELEALAEYLKTEKAAQ
jgi:hydrogenase small subunit